MAASLTKSFAASTSNAFSASVGFTEIPPTLTPAPVANVNADLASSGVFATTLRIAFICLA